MTDHKKTWDVFANEIFVFTYMYKIKDDVLLHGKQCDPKQSQNHQLDWADFTQNCPVGNQAAGHAEVRIDQAGKMQQYNLTRRTMESRWHCEGTSKVSLSFTRTFTTSLLSNHYSNMIRTTVLNWYQLNGWLQLLPLCFSNRTMRVYNHISLSDDEKFLVIKLN